jgi:hypothetical protein
MWDRKPTAHYLIPLPPAQQLNNVVNYNNQLIQTGTQDPFTFNDQTETSHIRSKSGDEVDIPDQIPPPF